MERGRGGDAAYCIGHSVSVEMRQGCACGSVLQEVRKSRATAPSSDHCNFWLQNAAQPVCILYALAFIWDYRLEVLLEPLDEPLQHACMLMLKGKCATAGSTGHCTHGSCCPAGKREKIACVCPFWCLCAL